MNTLRALLDTNIFIPMEDSSNNLDEQLATLHRFSQLSKFEILIHSESRKDILRDKNKSRRDAMLSRLDKYSLLEEPPTFSKIDDESSLFGVPKKENDKVDNLILYALYKDCVNSLVTEDKGIHKKAQKLGLSERVYNIEDFVNSLSFLESPEHYKHPSIEDVYCHNLNIDDPMFLSLIDGYKEFNKWLAKCSREGRKAWVSYNDDEKLNAVCIYKNEEDPIVTKDNKALRGRVLKLCTFKVKKTGFKLGELLLKQSFTYAIKNNIDYIYLTIEPKKHEGLRALVSTYGFEKYGTDNKGRDDVYIKQFLKQSSKSLPIEKLVPLDFAIKYFPTVQISSNNAYIVPIKPSYHKRLFPEAQHQKSLFIDQENTAGNSIRQAYLCKSPITSIKPGDVLFFYRSNDQKAITSYGIVEQFFIENASEKILQWVAKRTVYTYSEIEKMAGSDIKIILFRIVHHLDNIYYFDQMIKDKIINGSIQSITKLSRDNLSKLINVVKINDRFVSN